MDNKVVLFVIHQCVSCGWDEGYPRGAYVDIQNTTIDMACLIVLKSDIHSFSLWLLKLQLLFIISNMCHDPERWCQTRHHLVQNFLFLFSFPLFFNFPPSEHDPVFGRSIYWRPT